MHTPLREFSSSRPISRIGPKPARSPDIGRPRQPWAEIGPTSTELGRNSTNIGQLRLDSTNLGRFQPNLFRTRPTWSRPNLTDSGPTSIIFEPVPTEFGPYSTEFGWMLTGFGRNFGISCPDVGNVWQNPGTLGQTWIHAWLDVDIFGMPLGRRNDALERLLSKV